MIFPSPEAYKKDLSTSSGSVGSFQVTSSLYFEFGHAILLQKQEGDFIFLWV